MKEKQPPWTIGFERKKGEMIELETAELVDDGDSVVLNYQISVSGKSSTLWFRFDTCYKEAISYEVADGVVIALLPFAMRGGYHIHSTIPLSERLWFQLTEQVIPQLCKTDAELWHTELQFPQLCTHFLPTKTACAMSCGVDSFTTFFQYTHRDCSRWNVNLLTFFQNGAHHNGEIGHSKSEGQLFQQQLTHVRCFCKSVNYPLLSVSSNLDEFLSTMFWSDSFHYTHTFRNSGFVLLLQKLIRSYYYAGASDITGFAASLWIDTERYDKWLLPNLSTDSTQLYSVNTSMNRIEKTLYISQFPETYNHLLVCYAGGENCGKCSKCVRLLLTLDYLGLLEQYRSSIPYDTYKRNQHWYESELLRRRRVDPCLQEVYQLGLAKGIRYSCKARSKAFYLNRLSDTIDFRDYLRSKIRSASH